MGYGKNGDFHTGIPGEARSPTTFMRTCLILGGTEGSEAAIGSPM
jgi:hypothetical protein